MVNIIWATALYNNNPHTYTHRTENKNRNENRIIFMFHEIAPAFVFCPLHSFDIDSIMEFPLFF